MSAIGPLILQISASLELSAAFSGLLTTLPLLLFALVSPLAGKLSPRASDRLLVPYCLLFSLVGALLRAYAGVIGLIGGTVLLGLGIGVLNVYMPVFVRAVFPTQTGLAMGVYTMSMTLLSALAAGFCVPLAESLHGWRHALASFAILPLLAIPVWCATTPREQSHAAQIDAAPLRETGRSWTNWCVAIFMSLQSALFFSMIAWLPSMLGEQGVHAGDAGRLVLVMQLVSLTSNLLMPILMQRYPKRRAAFAFACGALYACGFALLLMPNPSSALIVTCIVLLGLGSGASLSFALTLIAIVGASRRETVGLSAFAQSVGYLLAAPMPALLGSLFDALGSFRMPVLVLLLLCVPMALCGRRAVR